MIKLLYTVTLLLNIHLFSVEYLLTFDDGPTKYTKTIVDILKQNNIDNAIFFVTDRGTGQLKMYTNSLKYVIDNGYTIGNHTFSHSKISNYSSIYDYKFELSKVHTFVKDNCGYTIKYYRPPRGSQNNIITRSYQLMNYEIVPWDLDLDPFIQSKTKIKTQIENQTSGSKCIILLHEKIETVKYLSNVIKIIR